MYSMISSVPVPGDTPFTHLARRFLISARMFGLPVMNIGWPLVEKFVMQGVLRLPSSAATHEIPSDMKHSKARVLSA